jgi:hypothetical protein
MGAEPETLEGVTPADRVLLLELLCAAKPIVSLRTGLERLILAAVFADVTIVIPTGIRAAVG